MTPPDSNDAQNLDQAPKIRGYRIEEVLGRGGMGMVYKGVHKGLDRPVAIKSFFLDATGEGRDASLARFLHEAQMLAQFGGRGNIVQVYDLATDSEGNDFIVMEYVEGVNLEDIMASGARPTIYEAVSIIAETARALGLAHEHQVIHRDVKPANVMVTEEGRVKVMDFGIARSPDSPVQTRMGFAFGTTHYMAPEQLQRQATYDGRSDIYALSIVLYYLICGQLPFDDDNPAILIKKQRNAAPPPPSGLDARVSRALESIILRGLEKDPAKRFQTAQEFEHYLKHLLRTETREGDSSIACEQGIKSLIRRMKAANLGDQAAMGAPDAGNVPPPMPERTPPQEFPGQAPPAGQPGADGAWPADLFQPQQPGAAPQQPSDQWQQSGGFHQQPGDQWPQPSDQWQQSGGFQQPSDQWQSGGFQQQPGDQWQQGGDFQDIYQGGGGPESFEETLVQPRAVGGDFDPSSMDFYTTLPGGQVQTLSSMPLHLAGDKGGVLKALLGAEAFDKLQRAKWFRKLHLHKVDWSSPVTLAVAGGGAMVFISLLALVFLGGGSGKASPPPSGGSRTAVPTPWPTAPIPEYTPAPTPWATPTYTPAPPPPRRTPRPLFTPAPTPSPTPAPLFTPRPENTPAPLPFSTTPRPFLQTPLPTPPPIPAFTPSGDSSRRTLEKIGELAGHSGAVWSVAFSPDGRRAVSGGKDETVRVWDLGRRTATTSLPFGTARPEGVNAVAWSGNSGGRGERVVAGCDNGVGYVWDAQTGRFLFELKGHRRGAIYSAAFSPDSLYIATGGRDATVRVWDARTGDQLRQLEGHGAAVTSVDFSSTDLRILSASQDWAIREWDARTGQQLAELLGHDDAIDQALFLPGGNEALSCSWDGTVRQWDLKRRREIRVLERQNSRFRALAVSASGRLALTGDEGRHAALWSLETGAELASATAHVGSIHSAAFSPDETRALTASEDGSIFLWRLP